MPHPESSHIPNETIQANLPTKEIAPQPPLACQTWKKDRNSLLFIFLLYLNAGMTSGLLFVTIPVILMSKGATYKDLFLISFSYIPLCFKSLLAPWMNKHYIKSIGKRKTYYLPAQYLIGLIIFLLSSYGESLFDVSSIPLLSAAAILVIFLTMFSDISLDGWMVSLISKENSSYAASYQSLGGAIGFFIAYNIFIPLNSLEFCNEYIYSTPQEEPLMETRTFMHLIATSSILITSLVQLFLKEEEQDGAVKQENKEESNQATFVQMMKILLRNSSFRKLIFIFCSWNLIFGPVHNLFGNMVMESGISKELWTNLNAPLTPINMVLTIYLGKLCKKYSETLLAKYFYWLRIVCTFFLFGTLMTINMLPYGLKIAALFLSTVISSITFNGLCFTLGSFSNKIARETYGGPLMSTFGSLGYVHRLVSDIVLFAFLDQFGWTNSAIGSMVGMILYGVVLVKALGCFENKNLKDLVMEKGIVKEKQE